MRVLQCARVDPELGLEVSLRIQLRLAASARVGSRCWRLQAPVMRLPCSTAACARHPGCSRSALVPSVSDWDVYEPRAAAHHTAYTSGV